MIYYTGDIHGSTLEIVTFCIRFKPTKDDAIVILGDVGANYFGTRLVLQSSIQMQVAFTGLDETMYAVYSYTNYSGKTQSVTVKGEDFIQVNGMYGVELNKLVYADARQTVTVQIFSADGTLLSIVNDSIESYVNRSGADTPLYDALIKFADSAKVYLAK